MLNSPQPNIAVCCTDDDIITQAQDLAEQLHFPFITNSHNEEAMKYDYLLVFTRDYLGIQKPTEKKLPPFHIDFLSSKMIYRSKQAGLRKELLARAIGMHPRENPFIIDVTAGLGRDSFILASLGFEITMLERSTIIYALLADALERAKRNERIAPIIERMHLIHANALEWLEEKQCDVITLDPMFPERKKSSLVKKEMVILQKLLGNDDDSEQLFKLSLTCATHRVVVKRPRLAENISGQLPNFSLEGKSSRFDIYLGSGSQLKR
jgi:16S rRNA (guanine1516-N2)-methyltransferase